MEPDSCHKPSLLERLSHWLMREPEDREQLIELLQGAYENSLMDADALAMIEGVLQVSEMRVGEIMIPRAQMDIVDINDPPEVFIPFVIETAQSRFPVIDKDKDDVIGILLARNVERREKKNHPLRRILSLEEQDGDVLITTTMGMARAIGDAVHHAYKGELCYQYTDEADILRVVWKR